MSPYSSIFECVVTLRQHDLLQNGLLSSSDLPERGRRLRHEGLLDLSNEIVHGPRRRVVLKGLNGAEEPEVEDAIVGAVRRLVRDRDVEAIGQARGQNLRVVGYAMRRCVVLIKMNGPTPTRR